MFWHKPIRTGNLRDSDWCGSILHHIGRILKQRHLGTKRSRVGINKPGPTPPVIIIYMRQSLDTFVVLGESLTATHTHQWITRNCWRLDWMVTCRFMIWSLWCNINQGRIGHLRALTEHVRKIQVYIIFYIQKPWMHMDKKRQDYLQNVHSAKLESFFFISWSQTHITSSWTRFASMAWSSLTNSFMWFAKSHLCRLWGDPIGWWTVSLPEPDGGIGGSSVERDQWSTVRLSFSLSLLFIP